MPPFRRVGVVLKERFDGATEVSVGAHMKKSHTLTQILYQNLL